MYSPALVYTVANVGLLQVISARILLFRSGPPPCPRALETC